MSADRGEYRLSLWGVVGNLSAMLRVREPGESELEVRARGTGYKSPEAAEAAMREKLGHKPQRGARQ